jgi:hypothetical protein
VLLPLISAKVHGFLDDAVVLGYLMGAYILGLTGRAMAIALVGAFVHFFITRFTDYPAGFVKLLSFRTHGFIELAEGVFVLVVTWTILPAETPGKHLLFLTLLGVSQLVAFGFSDYRFPPAAVGANRNDPS